jgi:hypothetical protein
VAYRGFSGRGTTLLVQVGDQDAGDGEEGVDLLSHSYDTPKVGAAMYLLDLRA